MSTTLADVLGFVLNEATESDMDRIMGAWKTRRKTLAAENLATVKVGDRVRLAGLSPKFLNGATGVVTGINQTTVAFKVDDTAPQRVKDRLGAPWQDARVPAGCVEVIS